MKQITRKILILIHLLGIYSNLKAWSEDDLLKKNRLMNLDTALMKKVLYPYYQLTFINDLNPALGLISNDEGYTLGIHHRLRIVKNSRQRFYDVKLTSDLFTDYLYHGGYSDQGKWIVPEEFTEINTLSFSFNQYIDNKKIFAGIEVGTGVRNKNRAIPGFALYLQGGETGRGGYHSLLTMHANDNVATGEIKPFIYISPSIRKLVTSKTRNEYRDPFFIDIQTGFSLGTSQIKSTAFVRMHSELPVIQTYNARKKVFKLSGIFRSVLLAHPSGLQFNPELGLEFQILFVSIGYNSIFYFGKQNAEVINYYDNEPLMRGYIKVHF